MVNARPDGDVIQAADHRRSDVQDPQDDEQPIHYIASSSRLNSI
jgi:hypothetical protein